MPSNTPWLGVLTPNLSTEKILNPGPSEILLFSSIQADPYGNISFILIFLLL